MVVVYVNQSGHWNEFGRTEIIWDNLNPEFATKFTMDYRFEIQQKIKFEVYDIGTKGFKFLAPFFFEFFGGKI